MANTPKKTRTDATIRRSSLRAAGGGPERGASDGDFDLGLRAQLAHVLAQHLAQGLVLQVVRDLVLGFGERRLAGRAVLLRADDVVPELALDDAARLPRL